ncbi:non-ribosomal peptide synthetase, partial [Pseudomonas savastanoi]
WDTRTDTAGRTWVALDAKAPAAHIQRVIAHAKIELIITGASLYPNAAALAGDSVKVILCDQLPVGSIALRPANNIAYIIYTSGSTGVPKGVFQSHQNLLRHIDTYKQSIDINSDDRVTLLPSTSVDAGLMDIFGALTSGAALHLFDVHSQGIEALPAWLNHQEITVYHSTPTLFRGLCNAAPADMVFPTVRAVVLGGETAYETDFRHFNRRFAADAILINGLGPTESTIALQAFYHTQDRLPEGTLPVGRPVPGMSVLLMDANRKIVAHEGELVLCSEALALGYWNDPESSEKAFISAHEPDGKRLYFTGDMARKLNDGSFLHLGRIDNQIKLRGHRIEAGEVEAAIRRLECVAEVAVVKYRFDSGVESLVAVVTPGKHTPHSKASIISRLKQVLPAYMVPHNIVVVDRLPLTLSGKIDRRQVLKALTLDELPAIELISVDLTPLQQEVLDFCRKELGAGVGIDSNFFAVGGDSLIASRLLSMIRKRVDVSCSLSAFFDAPTLRQWTSLIEESTSNAGASMSAPVLAQGKAPLSFSQEQIWISQEFSTEKSLYTLLYGLKIEGQLDINQMTKAFALLVQRHESLRSSVEIYEGTLFQSIRDAADLTFELKVIDTEPELHPKRLKEEIALVAFNPQHERNGPLIKASLISGHSSEHYMIIALHHLAADGLAASTLFKDLGAIYRSLLTGAEIEPLVQQSSYLDYCRSQRQWMNSPDYKRHQQWWLEHLDGLPALALPTDFSRPSTPTYSVALHRFKLPANLHAELKQVAAECAVTPYMLYLAAFSLMLARCSGQEDFAVASPASGRLSMEHLDVVGTFVNPILVRIRIDEDLAPSAFISYIKQAVLESLDHQQFPVSHLTATCLDSRQTFSSSLFNVMLAVQKRPEWGLSSDHLSTTDLCLNQQTLVSDLCLTLYEGSAEVECEFEYATDLFIHETIERYADYFQRLLSGIVSNQSLHVDALPMLSDEEIRHLLGRVDHPTAAEHGNQSLYGRFTAFAQTQPRAMAIWSPEGNLTYEELHSEVVALALALRQSGSGIGRLVPVIASDSRHVVTAWLAINSIGAVFVPIEATWPEPRVLEATVRCAANVVVVAAKLQFRPQKRCQVIQLPLQPEQVTESTAIDTVRYDPEAAIYGIFTSGSTAAPKLVIVPQRGISNRFDWMTEELSAGHAPVTLQTTTHVYDSAVWQLLWPLTVGGQIVIPTENLAFDIERLVSYIANFKVSIIDFVPSVFDVVVQQLRARGQPLQELSTLKHIILGGESLQGPALKLFAERYPNVTLLNLYGPTEASIGCIFSTLRDFEPPYPIGKPIPNVSAFVLDHRQRLSPRGTPGELYLGGACVGLGYWGDESATQAAFITNPYRLFSHSPKIYRTGDQVRWQGEDLYFLGRYDDQVKVRGLRIQPAEIAEKLLAHPDIDDVVVDVRPVKGKPALCSWIRPSVPRDIRQYCMDYLPTSLIPEYFIACESFPIAASGKLNKRALPDPPVVVLSDSHRSARRGTAKSEALAELWAEVLGVDKSEIDHDKNFFEQGGNSLLAIQLLNRLKKSFGIRLSIADIFRFSQLEAFAKRYLGGN